MRRGRAQAVAKSKCSGRAVEAVDESGGSGHGADGEGWTGGETSYGSGVSLIKVLEELISVDMGGWFPAVMCFGEPLPPDLIL